MKLTSKEQYVLGQILKSARGNGYDFGFSDEIEPRADIDNLGGVISSLVKKNLIDVHYEKVNGKPITQICFKEDCDIDSLKRMAGLI